MCLYFCYENLGSQWIKDVIGKAYSGRNFRNTLMETNLFWYWVLVEVALLFYTGLGGGYFILFYT